MEVKEGKVFSFKETTNKSWLGGYDVMTAIIVLKTFCKNYWTLCIMKLIFDHGGGYLFCTIIVRFLLNGILCMNIILV